MPAKHRRDGSAPAEQFNIFTGGLLDNTRLVIYLKDADGRYIYVNRRYEDLAGVPRSFLAGKRDTDLFPREVAELFIEQDRQVMAARKPVEFEETIPLRDGVHSFITEKFPMFGPGGRVTAVGGFCTEITTQKDRAAESLAEERERLAVTMRSISDGVVATDTRCAVTMMNTSAEELAGVPPKDAAGRQVDDVLVQLSGSPGRLFARLAESAMSGGAGAGAPAAVTLLSRGLPRTVLPSAGAVKDRGGSVIGAVITLRDVTRSMELELQAKLAAESVLEAREQEKRRLSALLQDIVGSLQVGLSAQLLLLERDLRKGDKKAALLHLKKAGELLDGSARAAKEASMDSWPPSIAISGLAPALRSLVAAFSARTGIKTRGSINLPEGVPPADSRTAMAVYRIVQEILFGTETYSGATRAEINIGAEKGRIIISGGDDGKGFEMRDLDKTKFAADIGRVEAEVKSVGGTIEMISKPGQGLKARIELPLPSAGEAA